MDPLMDLLTDLQAGATHTIHRIILDQILEVTADTEAVTKITKTDKLTTGTTIETEGTNRTHDMTREIIAFRIGMTIPKTETD